MVFTLQYNRWIGKGQFSVALVFLLFPTLCPFWMFLVWRQLVNILLARTIDPAPGYVLRFPICQISFVFQPVPLQYSHNNSFLPLAWLCLLSFENFFSSSLATFSFFHFKPEGKWAVTSVAGTRTSPVARLGPAPAQETAKSPSQGRIFTSSQSSSSLLRSWAKSNLAID